MMISLASNARANRPPKLLAHFLIGARSGRLERKCIFENGGNQAWIAADHIYSGRIVYNRR
jgi:hypothetical protein